MPINGVNIPAADNRGRAFPYKDNDFHFVGPALVDGKLWRVSIWLNQSTNGRSYVRMQFDNPADYPEETK